MKEDNLLEQIATLLQGVLQNPGKTLQNLQNEGGLIEPEKVLSRTDKIVGELTAEQLILYHHWRINEKRAGLIRARVQLEGNKGRNTDDLEEYVKLRTMEDLARRLFWVAVSEQFGEWSSKECLVVGQFNGQPMVVVEKNPSEEKHEGVSVMISVDEASTDLLRTLFAAAVSESCPHCVHYHHHPKEKEETGN